MPRDRHILIVPDKFKGTLTARQAAETIAAGWHSARPQDTLELLPMADGGEGFGEILGTRIGAQRQSCTTLDAAGRVHTAFWWYAPDSRTAIVETAQSNGLALLPARHYPPCQLDTYGVGLMLQAAHRAGARRVYAGLGGSATNDGGFGMARALGWRFLDHRDHEITEWTALDQLARMDRPAAALQFDELIIAVDVTNPLLGPQGASRIYGPQKGLRPVDMPMAEAALSRLAAAVRDLCGEDIAACPGAGAAGGLGFGLRAFCRGRFESGAVIFAALAQLSARVAQADIIITAEGALDEQSLMGKGVGAIAGAAAEAHKPCICLAGSITAGLSAPWPRFSAYAIVPQIAEFTRAMAEPEACLQQLAYSVAAQLRA